MYTEGFEQWFKGNKNWSLPISEWSKTTTEICRKATQENLEIISENFNRFSDHLKHLSTIRKPEEWISVPKDCLDKELSAATQMMQRVMNIYMQNIEAFSKLCSASQEAVASKMEKEKSGK